MSSQQIQRRIGKSGISASAVGLGTWAIGGWMWGGTDEAESIAAIRAAIDAGVTLIDTAPAYGLGRSEEIVGKAIAGRRDAVVLATKCGLVWHTDRGRHMATKGNADRSRSHGHRVVGFAAEGPLHLQQIPSFGLLFMDACLRLVRRPDTVPVERGSSQIECRCDHVAPLGSRA